MMYKTGETVSVDFTTTSLETQEAADADALPTGTLVINGVDNAAVVTIANKETGVYRASVTLPTIADGATLQIRIHATMDGKDGKAVVWRGLGVTAQPADVLSAVESLAATGVEFSSPAVSAGGTLTIVQGDDYPQTRPITITVTGTGVGSLTSDTWNLHLNTPGVAPVSSTAFQKNTIDADTLQLKFAVPKTSGTEALVATTGSYAIKHIPAATTNEYTVKRGKLAVIPDAAVEQS